MRFFCITRDFLSDTNDLLREACEKRDIEYVDMEPDYFDYESSLRPEAGDLMYRVATDISASRLEQLLYHPGVVTFYATPLFGCYNQQELFVKNGLPMPKTVQTVTSNREQLERHVAYLGGFPVVLKVLGSEGGVGVIKVESQESLNSMMDYMRDSPYLMEFFDHAVAYRLVVVGDDIVDTEARYPSDTDFRTNCAGSEALGQVEPPEQAKRLALQAARALGMEFGGADILHATNGDMVIAEFNSPCFFADQQKDYDVDIAGRMVEHLMNKAQSLPKTTQL